MKRCRTVFSALAAGWLGVAAALAGDGGDPLDALRAPPAGVGEFPAGVVVHAAGGVRLDRAWLDGENEIVPVPGDRLHPGDRLRTDAEGELEIVWGVNVRLRLGRSTRMDIVSGEASADDATAAAPVVGAGRALWRLGRGTVRVRVRENIFFPAILLLASSHDLITVRRGDVAMRLDSVGSQVWVGAGGVEAATRAWRGSLSAGEGLSERGTVVPWRGGNAPAWVADLVFTVDRAAEIAPP